MQLNTSLVKGPLVSVPGVPFPAASVCGCRGGEVLSACVASRLALALMRGHAGQRGLCFPSCTLPGGREGAQTGAWLPGGHCPHGGPAGVSTPCYSISCGRATGWTHHALPGTREPVILVLTHVLS